MMTGPYPAIKGNTKKRKAFSLPFVPLHPGRLWMPLLCLFLLLGACSDSSVNPTIPNVFVNEEINVNSQLYPELRRDGGYAYISGGYKGILIVRQYAGQYLAFERTCPYDPASACSTIEMDESNLFIVDKCCGSQFNLQGGVMGGPAIHPLKRYNTSLSGSILYISN